MLHLLLLLLQSSSTPFHAPIHVIFGVSAAVAAASTSWCTASMGAGPPLRPPSALGKAVGLTCRQDRPTRSHIGLDKIIGGATSAQSGMHGGT